MPVMPEQTKQRRGEWVLSIMSNRWQYSLNVTHSMEHIRSFRNFDIYATTNEQETMHFAYTCSHYSHSHSRRTIADRHTACVSNILTFFVSPLDPLLLRLIYPIHAHTWVFLRLFHSLMCALNQCDSPYR